MRKNRLDPRPANRSGQILFFLFAALAAVLSLTVCTKSSFLYPLNDWVDVHCYFTVGRGILHGMVPYRDLYEQKGPLVYFLYYLAACVSEKSFLGVYLLECVCFACFLYLSGKIAETLSDLRGAFWPAVPALAILIPVSPAFSHGGSAEELFLPVFALEMWVVFRAIHRNTALTNREAVLLGLCFAAALWTKYTFCGLSVGMGLAVILWYISEGRARALPGTACYFLLGVVLLSVPVIGWFAAHGAADDLWQTYFVNNLARYSQNIRSGIYDPPLLNLLNNLTWSVPAMIGLIWMLLKSKQNRWEAAAAWLGAVSLFVFTYFNKRRYPYYALVLSVFAPTGVSALCRIVYSALKDKEQLLRRLTAAVTVILLLFTPILTYTLSSNTYLMKIPREDTPQYRFAKKIRESDDPSLLNCGFLDGGFYFAAGVLPEQRYFCTLNIDLPEMNEAIQQSIRQGETAFVITRQRPLQDAAAYRLADECSMVFEGREWKYYLYQRR